MLHESAQHIDLPWTWQSPGPDEWCPGPGHVPGMPARAGSNPPLACWFAARFMRGTQAAVSAPAPIRLTAPRGLAICRVAGTPRSCPFEPVAVHRFLRDDRRATRVLDWLARYCSLLRSWPCSLSGIWGLVVAERGQINGRRGHGMDKPGTWLDIIDEFLHGLVGIQRRCRFRAALLSSGEPGCPLYGVRELSFPSSGARRGADIARDVVDVRARTWLLGELARRRVPGDSLTDPGPAGRILRCPLVRPCQADRRWLPIACVPRSWAKGGC